MSLRRVRIALIGTGHIGGSLALALRAAGTARQVIGYDADAGRAQAAQARGVIDQVAPSAEAAVEDAGLVVLAVPVRAMGPVLARIAPALASGCNVTDVGSTKASVLAHAQASLREPGRFVGGHPMAGTEQSGPDAADGDLFRGRIAFVTPAEGASADAVEAIESMWRVCGARPVRIGAAEHDQLVAAVSHLPHAVAYALVSAVGQSGGAARGLAAGGFRDTTRIASSDPVMWRDVFLDNRDEVLAMIDRFSVHLAGLRGLIAAGDGPGLERELARIRAEREGILA
jgi:prephenate dehydrogenase